MPARLSVTLATAFLMGAIVAVQAATTMTIVQKGLQLNKNSVTLTKGDRLVFTNDDDVIHNIHIFGPGSDEEKDLGLQKPGVPLTYAFDKAGSYRVRCNIHPSVKMAVTVQ